MFYSSVVLYIFYVTVGVFVWNILRIEAVSGPPNVDALSAQRPRASENRRSNPKSQFGSSAGNNERKPNIILFLTDDQDVELGSLNYMPKTLKLLRDSGAELRHAYTTTPMCCPSRSSLLTGLYMHNHNVYTNNDNCSSPLWQATHETRSFATYLSNAGYRTGYFGKYLNKYNGSYIPPGWREWGGLVMNSRYYNYTVNLNGKKIKHGDDYHKDYYPDLIANDSVSFLRHSKRSSSRKPVLLVMSFPAPHGPEDAAPQYSNMFFNVTSHHTPSYDFAPNPDKQWILQVTGKMKPIHRQFTNLLMTKRLQTLQSVDAAVEKVYQELKDLGELDNTYLIYTSDHGYHLGQFGLVKGKSFPFEFDVRVPFLIRGPGIDPGTIIDEVVLNIDLAPTFLDIAGVEPPPHMDGRSIFKLLGSKRRKNSRKYVMRWPDTFLIESSGRRDSSDLLKDLKFKNKHNIFNESSPTTVPSFTSLLVSSEDGIPVDLDEDKKLRQNEDGDDNDDPDNDEDDEDTAVEDDDDIENKQAPGAIENVLSDLQPDNRLLPVAHGGLSKAEKLALECSRPEFNTPCQPGQKWHCTIERNRWRKHKCKNRPLGLYSSSPTKKCACFTPSGIMYTRLEPDERRMQREFLRSHVNKEFRPKFINGVRSKRSADFDGIAENWNMPRNKRDVASVDGHISSIINVIQDKIVGLQPTNDSVNSHVNCNVTSSGEVHCSEQIYQNPKIWRMNRKKIDRQIRKLRMHLEKLKDIRHHLQKNKPVQLNMDKQVDNANEENIKSLHHEIKLIVNNSKDIDLLSQSTNYESSDIDKSVDPNKHRHHHQVLYDLQASTVNITSSTENILSTLSSTFTSPNITDSMLLTTTVTNYPPPALNTSVKKEKIDTIPGRRKIDVTILEPVLSHSSDKKSSSPYLPDTCYCEPDLPNVIDSKAAAREARRKLKEEKLRKKERKLRRKAKLEKECSLEKMNCFNHDNEHWRTPPYWTNGPFCFCMNANNNTYSCLRTINSTHNFLYCEFVTGLVTYYNLRLDPFEQSNRIHLLSFLEKSWLHDTLAQLKGCQGTEECSVGSANQPRRRFPPMPPAPSLYSPNAGQIIIRKGAWKSSGKNWRQLLTEPNQWSLSPRKPN